MYFVFHILHHFLTNVILKHNIVCLFTVNRIRLLKIIQNEIGIQRKKQVTPMILMENIRVNLVHLKYIATLIHIDIVDIKPPLIHIINMEVNHLIIVVTLLVIYHQYAQIMFQILQNIQHNNIRFKIDLFLMVMFEVKRRRI